MTDKTAFGDRMKHYEMAEAGRRLMPLLPICVRLDGKRFSAFTKGLARPYDVRLSRLMIDVTHYLVAETQALVGYTQSDEISLVYHSNTYSSQVFFDGRIQKLTSVLASMVTAKFGALLPERIPERAGAMPLFDARVWNVPNQVEAANTLLWREQDATKNSISMAARALYSHSALKGKNGRDMQEMMFGKGVNWNDYPAFFKRGTFVQRRKVSHPFTTEELALLPPKHEAHNNPDLMVERTEIRELEMPPFSKVINRVAVIFAGDDPQVASPSPMV
ncbi:MAG: tRNA(His) guanylyltransferase Thg1 family protein [Myxococcota bacterium]